jgi:hypothetical protein
MGSGNKKGKAIDMGNYVAKEREQAAYVWCIHNNIFIAPKAKSTTEWYICITSNGKTTQSPLAYERIDIWKEIYKFYTYYYDKYSGVKVVKEVQPRKFIKEEPVKQKEKPIINTLF